MLPLLPYIVGILATLLVLFLPRPKDLYVILFIMPWVALVIEFGVSLKVSEFVLMILFLKYLTVGNIRPNNFVGWGPLLVFILIAIGSAIYTLELGPKVPLFAGGSPFRNGYGRVFTTLLSLLLVLLYLLLIFSSRRVIDPIEFLKVYIWSSLLLAGLGLIQLFVFTLTGVDITPIGSLVGDEYVRSGYISIQGSSFLRVSSFGGEPKGLGQSLVIAVAILMVFGNRLGFRKMTYFSMIALLTIVIIATTSTSAFVTLFCIAVFVTILSKRKFPFTKSSIRNLMVAISMSVFGLYYSIAALTDTLAWRGYETSRSYWDAVKFRFIGRLRLDDTDSLIMESYVGDYIGLIYGRGLGLAHHYAYKYIPQHMLYYLDGKILPSKSGVSYYVGYAGLAGLCAMALFASNMIPAKDKLHRYHHERLHVLICRIQSLCLGLWAAHMLRLYTFDITWTVFALMGVMAYQVDAIARQRAREHLSDKMNLSIL